MLKQRTKMPSPAPQARQEVQEIPLKMVGGNHFGRYPTTSQEQTWNMIISDGCLVPYAGYKNVLTQSPNQKGRGIYASSRGNVMIAIWGSQCFLIKPGIAPNNIFVASFKGNLLTAVGDIFLAENNNGDIAFTDNIAIYVYNYLNDTYKTSAADFSLPPSLTNPGYIAFQNGRLLVANTTSTNWYLSASNDATTWPNDSAHIGALQSKPDKVQAAVPTPGGGNNLYLFGHNVVEQWQDVGNAIFPYQRSSTFNVDYGTINPSSIAALDDYVVWLSVNEQSGVSLMVIEGNRATAISTDGIDFKLANLSNPSNCTGFIYRQDGHVLYQFTFPDDNLSYIYDFTNKEFFTVSDENLNYHIARNVVFFNNQNYFVSLNGGNLYAFDSIYTNFDYGADNIQQIPRIRVTPPIRLPSQRMFIVKSLGFTIENGQPNSFTNLNTYANNGAEIATEGLISITTEGATILVVEDASVLMNDYVLASEAVDLSTSRDGGESFGNSWRLNMNAIGRRKSRFIWQRCGQANDLTCQFRFSGFGRFVVADDGLAELYL